ncbi:ATP synthase [Tanticharoenia sakaeratensis NBRC 103193]|jgi:F-type H+-transporting ATPase subunit b|uniref:ATP synthase subunit b n=1 Tax=Tanticharoenia sakaeratensis NBRC 103193 TaxID=1231623 RepID=A0A0D6MGU4_9PROT|nr:ATP synthase [Tanticharoenia sakaeratensis NBRC 103193]GBQ18441.1 ATP synthase F0 subunit beta' [Tanticharoenia sakaeratensis NBRC 103193]
MMVSHSLFDEPRFWSAVAFVVFFLLFGRKLWAAITKVLDERAEGVRRDLDEAGRLRREAEQMLEAATREREQALAEAREMIERSREEAASIAAAARREAEAVAARREQMARDRIAAAERAAVREVQDLAAEIAVQATRDVLAHHLEGNQPVGRRDADVLIDDALSALPGALTRATQARAA